MAGRAAGLWRRVRRDYEAVYWKHPANQAVLGRLRNVPADAVIANDVRALPLAVELGFPVVFDAHEYAPDELGDALWWRLATRPLVRWQCKEYIARAAAMTTVSDGIADAYERAYGVRAAVVRNAPWFADLRPTDEIVEQREELEEVLAGVANLPDDRREALIMRFALDMDNREIARALGRSEGATKVLIHRAIKQLDENLKEAGSDERG